MIAAVGETGASSSNQQRHELCSGMADGPQSSHTGQDLVLAVHILAIGFCSKSAAIVMSVTNHLQGQIPDDWAGFKAQSGAHPDHIEAVWCQLDIKHTSAFSFDRLSRLDLSHNNLTGLLIDVPNPNNFSTHLDLSSNQLTGTLAANWNNSFGSLVHLNLSHNQAAGSCQQRYVPHMFCAVEVLLQAPGLTKSA